MVVAELAMGGPRCYATVQDLIGELQTGRSWFLDNQIFLPRLKLRPQARGDQPPVFKTFTPGKGGTGTPCAAGHRKS